MTETIKARLNTPDQVPPWGVLNAFWAIIVAFLSIIIGSAIILALLGETQSENVVELAGWTVGGLLTIIFVTMTYRRSPDYWQAMRLSWAESSFVIVALPAGIITALVLEFLSQVIAGTSSLNQAVLNMPEIIPVFEQSDENNIRVLSVILLVFIQPFADELVFRGVALPAFRNSFGAWSGLIFSSFLYGAFHFAAYPPVGRDITLVWYALAIPLIAGIVFGIIRIMTVSTRAAILAHSVFGTTMIVIAFQRVQ